MSQENIEKLFRPVIVMTLLDLFKKRLFNVELYALSLLLGSRTLVIWPLMNSVSLGD